MQHTSRLETLVNALIKTARKLPQEPYKSLTWDRSKEMAAHSDSR
jgi:IS30 family transposase